MSLCTSVPKESGLQAIASEDTFSEGTGGALERKVLVWAEPPTPSGYPPPGSHPSPSPWSQ